MLNYIQKPKIKYIIKMYKLNCNVRSGNYKIPFCSFFLFMCYAIAVLL